MYTMAGIASRPALTQLVLSRQLQRQVQLARGLLNRTHTTAVTNKPKLIDLSRELYHRSPAHPFHPPVCITPWDTHQPMKAGNTVFRTASYALSMSDHAGTHVDAPKHFDPSPGALAINEMPLESFYTEAICLDLSHVELKASVSVAEMEDALQKSGQAIRTGDTVLLYMAFNKRISFDDPRWQHDFPGLSLEAVHWLADKGCKIFGVEAISPAPEGELNFQAHNACGERHHAY
jgi:kynurenine formamidase